MLWKACIPGACNVSGKRIKIELEFLQADLSYRNIQGWKKDLNGILFCFIWGSSISFSFVFICFMSILSLEKLPVCCELVYHFHLVILDFICLTIIRPSSKYGRKRRNTYDSVNWVWDWFSNYAFTFKFLSLISSHVYWQYVLPGYFVFKMLPIYLH